MKTARNPAQKVRAKTDKNGRGKPNARSGKPPIKDTARAPFERKAASASKNAPLSPRRTPKKALAPGALLSPVPAVLISCGSVETPNLLTVAWAGTICTHPPMVSISVRPERFSYPLIKESGEFVLNLPPAELVRAVDLCGVKSGRDGDKFALAGLTPVKAAGVKAPAVLECPVSFSCKVKEILPLGSHDLFLAEIVAIEAEERLFDEKGRLGLEKIGLFAYAHGEYFRLGEKIGSFGFSVRKKKG